MVRELENLTIVWKSSPKICIRTSIRFVMHDAESPREIFMQYSTVKENILKYQGLLYCTFLP